MNFLGEAITFMYLSMFGGIALETRLTPCIL